MQAVFSPLGEDGFYFAALNLRLNVYTASGFLGLFMAIVNMVAVWIWFEETEVDIYDGQQDVNVDCGEFPEIHTSKALLYPTLGI